MDADKAANMVAMPKNLYCAIERIYYRLVDFILNPDKEEIVEIIITIYDFIRALIL